MGKRYRRLNRGNPKESVKWSPFPGLHFCVLGRKHVGLFLDAAKEFFMFHKVKNVFPLPDLELSVQFSEGITKIYDLKPLMEKISAFCHFKKHPEDFADVSVDVGGYGIVWGDDLDLSCDELWKNGVLYP